jgi:hypothetical protein
MIRSTAISACAVLLLCGSLQAQQIRGRVVLQGTEEPVAAATVALLDAELNAIATARTDPAGAFVFSRLRPGSYQLQADRDGAQSALSRMIDAAAPGDATVLLEIPSPLLVLAMTCGAAAQSDSTTVLVGTVHDLTSDVALPGARLRLVQAAESRGEAVSDAAGHFRFCAVPVGAALTLNAEAWGRTAAFPLRLTTAEVSRIDVPLELGALQFAVAVTGSSPASGSGATLTMTLRDAATGSPMRGAAVWFGNKGLAAYSNGMGMVRVDGVGAGDHDLRVEMVGYGSRSMPVRVPAGQNLQLDVRVPAVPVALEPISVHSHMRSEFRTPRESNTRVDIIAGGNMAEAEDRGARVVDLLRGSFPGVFVHEGQYSTIHTPDLEYIVCVESLRRLDRLRLPDGVQEPFCDMVTVVMDGVPTFNAGQFLRNMSVRELESVEYLNPLDAGLRYGSRAAQSGALVLWSRGQGPHKSPSRHNF